jgi:peptide chain release factor 2
MRRRNGERRKHGGTETRRAMSEIHGWCCAVRITHLPTGIVVSCQGDYSHLKNREFAMRKLLGRLAVTQRPEAEEHTTALRGEQPAIDWDHPIRSYVFDPHPSVRDHRTNVETDNITAVTEGEIDPLIHSYLSLLRGSRE